MCRVLNWTNTLNIVFWEKKSRGNIIIYIKLIICNYWFIYIANPMCPAKQCSKCLFNLFYIYSLDSSSFPIFYKSMPYSLHTHATARGGNNWLRDLAPNSANLLWFSLSQRRNVSRLTPAAFANSYLYIAFMLQRYEKILNYASKLAIIYQA